MVNKKILRFIKKLEDHNYTKYYVERILDIDDDGKTMCPLHPDTSRNCFVDVEDDYFECAECGIKGSLVLLIMLVTKKSFKSVVLMLAGETKVEIPPIVLGLKPSWHRE